MGKSIRENKPQQYLLEFNENNLILALFSVHSLTPAPLWQSRHLFLSLITSISNAVVGQEAAAANEQKSQFAFALPSREFMECKEDGKEMRKKIILNIFIWWMIECPGVAWKNKRNELKQNYKLSLHCVYWVIFMFIRLMYLPFPLCSIRNGVLGNV